MLLIAFCGKFLQFLQAIYAKIVESIQARRIRVKLSIADQRPEGKKSRKCQEIEAAGKISQPAKFSQVALFTIFPLFTFPVFDTVTFLLQFFVSSHFIAYNSFWFWFFFFCLSSI